MQTKKILGGILIAYGAFGLGTCLINFYETGQIANLNICGVAIVGILMFFAGLQFFKAKKRKQQYFDNFKHKDLQGDPFS